MDSGNSGGGSMQSSSTGGGGGGGDEEFDSRAAADSSSISAFFNNPLGHHVSPLSNHHHHHHSSSSSSSMFDPLSNYFDPSSSRVPQQPVQLTNPNNNSFLNLDMVWSKNLRSDPNSTDLTNLNPTQQFFTPTRPDYPSLQIPQPQPQLPPQPQQQQQQQQEQPTSRPSPNTDQPSQNQNPNPNPVARNPKKRSRASRRAPTTVLTTDTSNFRAMVQEFTGIPAPPFTSSPFPRSRLDLFGGASSTLRSVIASHHHHLDPTTAPPPYLLRPFAQKLQQPPQPLSFAASSSMVDAIASTVSAATNAAASNNNNNNASTSVNYQLPQQQQNLLNINQQNPLLNFQPMKYPLVFGSIPKQQQPSDHSGLKNIGGVLEDQFGLSQGHVSPSIQNSSNPAGSNWPGDDRDDHQGTDQHHHHHQNHHHHHHQDLLRSINGNYSNTSSQQQQQQQQQQRGGGGVNGTKVVNFSASSSDFHGDKGQEIAAATTARNEGVMEPWICSSD